MMMMMMMDLVTEVGRRIAAVTPDSSPSSQRLLVAVQRSNDVDCISMKALMRLSYETAHCCPLVPLSCD